MFLGALGAVRGRTGFMLRTAAEASNQVITHKQISAHRSRAARKVLTSSCFYEVWKFARRRQKIVAKWRPAPAIVSGEVGERIKFCSFNQLFAIFCNIVSTFLGFRCTWSKDRPHARSLLLTFMTLFPTIAGHPLK